MPEYTLYEAALLGGSDLERLKKNSINISMASFLEDFIYLYIYDIMIIYVRIYIYILLFYILIETFVENNWYTLD